MQAKSTITKTYVNSFATVLKKIRPRANKNHYSWADSLFFKAVITATLLHTLKAIIACSSLDRPTLKQINAARNRSASKKFAQDDAVTERTLRRHIERLEELGLIEVTRTRDKRRNSRNAYVVRVPEEVLSCPSEDTMSPSICTPDHIVINNTKIDTPKEKPAPQLRLDFDDKQLAILATLLAWGTWKNLAHRWLAAYTVEEIQGGINYVTSKNINFNERGRYMGGIMKNLDERKRAESKLPELTKPAQREIPTQLVEQEAIRRLAARGMHDPRTGGVPEYDVCKKYDVALNDERARVRADMGHRYAT